MGKLYVEFISIHATHTGRDFNFVQCSSVSLISIHATHTGRDVLKDIRSAYANISIHATHTGRDRGYHAAEYLPAYFNSRDPYGPRSDQEPIITSLCKFQFTRPIRAAITKSWVTTLDRVISIHATHTGRDCNIQQIIAINLLRFSYIPYKKAWIRS